MIRFIKAHLPRPIKNLLRPVYHQLMKWWHRVKPISYKEQIQQELTRFDAEDEVNDLPEIFHYWSNKHLVPKFTPHGFSNPDEFFAFYAAKAIENKAKSHILSIGAGNCDTEVRLAQALKQQGFEHFTIHCMDINKMMFERGLELAKSCGVEQHLSFLLADFNLWQAERTFDMVLANQSLHHVVELEHLFSQIKLAMADGSYFVTSDMIGRNGHMRWPEALKVLKPIWQTMPDRYKYNHAFKRKEKKYINHDCSTQGFEGIRAQDILPLLKENFEFELIIPFANLVTVFIDRPFGPNFDVNKPEDLAFIDKIHNLDEQNFQDNIYQPTQMVAAMQKVQ